MLSELSESLESIIIIIIIIIMMIIIKCSIQNLINRSSGMPTRHARNGYFNQKWIPVYTPKVGEYRILN